MKQKAGSLKKETRLTDPWQIRPKWGGKNPNQWNQKHKREDNNKYHRNWGNHLRLFWEFIFQ
jgi:hypothetical protein